MSDNFRFDLTGAPLDKSLDIASDDKLKATGWAVDKDGKRLILYWAESTQATKLPAALNKEALVSFVESWLEGVDYGPEPDHDGHNSKGWRVYNESWRMVAGQWAAFVAIEPVWMMHGK